MVPPRIHMGLLKEMVPQKQWHPPLSIILWGPADYWMTTYFAHLKDYRVLDRPWMLLPKTKKWTATNNTRLEWQGMIRTHHKRRVVVLISNHHKYIPGIPPSSHHHVPQTMTSCKISSVMQQPTRLCTPIKPPERYSNRPLLSTGHTQLHTICYTRTETYQLSY